MPVSLFSMDLSAADFNSKSAVDTMGNCDNNNRSTSGILDVSPCPSSRLKVNLGSSASQLMQQQHQRQHSLSFPSSSRVFTQLRSNSVPNTPLVSNHGNGLPTTYNSSLVEQNSSGGEFFLSSQLSVCSTQSSFQHVRHTPKDTSNTSSSSNSNHHQGSNRNINNNNNTHNPYHHVRHNSYPNKSPQGCPFSLPTRRPPPIRCTHSRNSSLQRHRSPMDRTPLENVHNKDVSTPSFSSESSSGQYIYVHGFSNSGNNNNLNIPLNMQQIFLMDTLHSQDLSHFSLHEGTAVLSASGYESRQVALKNPSQQCSSSFSLPPLHRYFQSTVPVEPSLEEPVPQYKGRSQEENAVPLHNDFEKEQSCKGWVESLTSPLLPFSAINDTGRDKGEDQQSSGEKEEEEENIETGLWTDGAEVKPVEVLKVNTQGNPIPCPPVHPSIQTPTDEGMVPRSKDITTPIQCDDKIFRDIGSSISLFTTTRSLPSEVTSATPTTLLNIMGLKSSTLQFLFPTKEQTDDDVTNDGVGNNNEISFHEIANVKDNEECQPKSVSCSACPSQDFPVNVRTASRLHSTTLNEFIKSDDVSSCSAPCASSLQEGSLPMGMYLPQRRTSAKLLHPDVSACTSSASSSTFGFPSSTRRESAGATASPLSSPGVIGIAATPNITTTPADSTTSSPNYSPPPSWNARMKDVTVVNLTEFHPSSALLLKPSEPQPTSHIKYHTGRQKNVALMRNPKFSRSTEEIGGGSARNNSKRETFSSQEKIELQDEIEHMRNTFGTNKVLNTKEIQKDMSTDCTCSCPPGYMYPTNDMGIIHVATGDNGKAERSFSTTKLVERREHSKETAQNDEQNNDRPENESVCAINTDPIESLKASTHPEDQIEKGVQGDCTTAIDNSSDLYAQAVSTGIFEDRNLLLCDESSALLSNEHQLHHKQEQQIPLRPTTMPTFYIGAMEQRSDMTGSDLNSPVNQRSDSAYTKSCTDFGLSTNPGNSSSATMSAVRHPSPKPSSTTPSITVVPSDPFFSIPATTKEPKSSSLALTPLALPPHHRGPSDGIIACDFPLLHHTVESETHCDSPGRYLSAPRFATAAQVPPQPPQRDTPLSNWMIPSSSGDNQTEYVHSSLSTKEPHLENPPLPSLPPPSLALAPQTSLLFSSCGSSLYAPGENGNFPVSHELQLSFPFFPDSNMNHENGSAGNNTLCGMAAETEVGATTASPVLDVLGNGYSQPSAHSFEEQTVARNIGFASMQPSGIFSAIPTAPCVASEKRGGTSSLGFGSENALQSMPSPIHGQDLFSEMHSPLDHVQNWAMFVDSTRTHRESSMLFAIAGARSGGASSMTTTMMDDDDRTGLCASPCGVGDSTLDSVCTVDSRALDAVCGLGGGGSPPTSLRRPYTRAYPAHSPRASSSSSKNKYHSPLFPGGSSLELEGVSAMATMPYAPNSGV